MDRGWLSLAVNISVHVRGLGIAAPEIIKGLSQGLVIKGVAKLSRGLVGDYAPEPRFLEQPLPDVADGKASFL
jgi:hypothetical protein